MRRGFPALMLLFALADANVAGATTWPVPSAQHLTLQHAVDDAAVADGDTLELADGVYVAGGFVQVDMKTKLLTIRSASGDPDQCVLDLVNAPSGWALHYSSTITDYTGSRIENLGFTNASGSGGAAVRILGAGRIEVSGCRFSENNVGIEWLTGSAGTELGLNECEFQGGDYGVLVSFTAVDAMNCIFEGASHTGATCLISHFTNCTLRANHTGIQANEAILDGCDILDNSYAGASFSTFSSASDNVRALSSRFQGNGYDFPGGGLLITGGATLSVSIQDCVFENNAGTLGGGLSVQTTSGTGTVTIENTTFRDNTATGPGGAIYTFQVALVLNDVRVLGNTAGSGGGIHAVVGSLDLAHVLVARNHALDGAGGGIYALVDDISIAQTTVADNAATGYNGGGIWTTYFGGMTLDHSIIAFNEGQEGLWISAADCGRLTVPTCVDIVGNGGDWTQDCLEPLLAGTGNLREVPLFCDRQEDYDLAANSPCLAANHAECSEDIGFGGAACGSVRTAATSWGALKASYGP